MFKNPHALLSVGNALSLLLFLVLYGTFHGYPRERKLSYHYPANEGNGYIQSLPSERGWKGLGIKSPYIL